MLNVNRMRVLREVADRGSIAAAAEALFMTASAVSQQVAALEREAGVPLLDRSGRRARLTPAGERLVSHTERVLEVLEEAQADLDEIARGVAGRLRTCAFPTAARVLLVPALAALVKRFPHLDVTMSDLEPEESIPMLRVGDLDVVLSYEFDHLPGPANPGIDRHILLVEPIYVAMSAAHPCASGPMRVADLASEQWIVGRDGSPFLEVQLHVAHEAGFEPRLDLHSNDYQVILAAVQAGLGVTLVPPLALFARYPGVVFREPSDVSIHRRVVALTRRGAAGSPAVAAALTELRAVADRVSQRRTPPAP